MAAARCVTAPAHARLPAARGAGLCGLLLPPCALSGTWPAAAAGSWPQHLEDGEASAAVAAAVGAAGALVCLVDCDAASAAAQAGGDPTVLLQVSCAACPHAVAESAASSWAWFVC